MQRKPTRAWWGAYNEFCGDGSQLEFAQLKKKPKSTVSSCKTEDEEQIIFVAWLERKNIPFFHIPNGGYRNAREGAKFKRMGVRAGVPDMCIPLARSSRHGLFLEIKREVGGKLSDAQRFWGDILLKEGYAWEVGRGAAECIKIVLKYLEIEDDR